MSVYPRFIGSRAFDEAAPKAYTGPYPIRSHRTLADQPRPDLRIEQDLADAEHARQAIKVYRIPPRASQPEAPPVMMRVSLALGLIGGAALTGGAIFLMAIGALALGGGQ